jgi:hypothetical protein
MQKDYFRTSSKCPRSVEQPQGIGAYYYFAVSRIVASCLVGIDRYDI